LAIRARHRLCAAIRTYGERSTTLRRRTLALLAVIGLLFASCGTTQPGKPAPTVLGTQAPGQATEAPMPHY
jgi:hypothetical protein